MRIAVYGSGTAGQTLAAALSDLGHEVAVGTRDVARTLARPDGSALSAWLTEHPAVQLLAYPEAAKGAEVIVNATAGQSSVEALLAAGRDRLAGVVVMDVSNPLDFSAGMPPTLFVKDTSSLAEQIQAALPRALVVKTLNTMTAEVMVNPSALADADHSVFVSGDDAKAKAVVTALLTSLGHTDVIDLGDLSTARGAEMFLPLWLRLMGALGTTQFNIKVVR